MENDLKILLIENSEPDAILIMRELGKINKNTLFERVENESELSRELENNEWNIIVLDYSQLGTEAIKMLKILKEKNKSIPLIMILHNVEEKFELAKMQNDFVDFVMKNDLKDLSAIVSRQINIEE